MYAESQSWLRRACVAGKFYPSETSELTATLRKFLPASQESKTIAIMAPHAGYIYSGHTAGLAYRQTVITSSVFLLCPNHTGRGPRISVWNQGSWETPLGIVSVDSDLADAFLAQLGTSDQKAHLNEHAIEVHIPFLQMKRPTVKIVPIVLGGLSLEDCYEVGETLATISRGSLIIASTDMSHFISRSEAQKKDARALEAVIALNPDRLYQTVSALDISMCGFIPTAAMLVAAQKLGAETATILEYTDSGAATGDLSSVVGYASAVVI